MSYVVSIITIRYSHMGFIVISYLGVMNYIPGDLIDQHALTSSRKPYYASWKIRDLFGGFKVEFPGTVQDDDVGYVKRGSIA